MRPVTKKTMESSKNNIKLPRDGIKRQADEGSLVLRLAPSEGPLPRSRQHTELSGDRIADVVNATIPNAGAAQQAIAGGPDLDLIVQESQGEGRDPSKSVDREEGAGLGEFQQQDGVFGADPEVEVDEVLLKGQSVPQLADGPASEEGIDGQPREDLCDDVGREDSIRGFWRAHLIRQGIHHKASIPTARGLKRGSPPLLAIAISIANAPKAGEMEP